MPSERNSVPLKRSIKPGRKARYDGLFELIVHGNPESGAIPDGVHKLVKPRLGDRLWIRVCGNPDSVLVEVTVAISVVQVSGLCRPLLLEYDKLRRRHPAIVGAQLG